MATPREHSAGCSRLVGASSSWVAWLSWISFARQLDADDPGFRVLFVYGPGGVGKSTLLDEYAAVAGDAGACVVRVDGRDVAGTPQGVLDAVAEVLEVPADDGPVLPPFGERVVLLVDGYELAGPRGRVGA